MLSYSIFCWIVFPFIIIIAAFVETVINRIKNPNSPNSFEEIFKEEIGAVIIAIIAIIILWAISPLILPLAFAVLAVVFGSKVLNLGFNRVCDITAKVISSNLKDIQNGQE